ncbi:MAG: hypothetical protein IPP35_04235 [Elusimicrobia bacterium]|nr:hypothetical protein [Elusimicrobiota bacterium]
MNVLFVIRSTAHFVYHVSVLESLCRRGNRVRILVDEEWSRGKSREALDEFLRKTPSAAWAWSRRRSGPMRRFLFPLREAVTYSRYLGRRGQSGFYCARWERYLNREFRAIARIPFLRRLVFGPLLRSFHKALECVAGADQVIVRAIAADLPDVVVLSPLNMRFSEEIEYLKAAQFLGLPTVGIVLSWDNLTTKGMFHARPDRLLVWNEEHHREAVELHGFTSDQIVVAGAPFFDKWRDPQDSGAAYAKVSQSLTRAPDKPFVLYLGSSPNIAPDEAWVIRRLAALIKSSQHPALSGLDVLVRPHPSQVVKLSVLLTEGFAVWPQKPEDLRDSPPDTPRAIAEFFGVISRCVAAVGLNTSGMLDTLICDRPTVALLLPEFSATQTTALHFKVLAKFEALAMADGFESCVNLLADISGGKDEKRAERKNFIRKFVWPLGPARSAGDIMAEAIEREAQGNTHFPAPLCKGVRTRRSHPRGGGKDASKNNK